MPIVVGIDLGGTELRAAAMDESAQVLRHARLPTAADAGPAAIVEQMARLVDEVSSGLVPVGIGIGSPGPLDAASGTVIHAPMLRGWRDVPLARLVTERTGLPTFLENDANAAALAEWRLGAARGLRHVVYVTVSTGIGGGIIVDGRLLHGHRSLAGEIGHMIVTEDPVPCACGGFGCWETLASGSALGRRAEAAGLQTDGPMTARLVAERAAAGDETAQRLMAEEARYLGIGFANLLHLYAPEMIVVGGGVSAALPMMTEEITRTVAARAMPAYRNVPIRAAALGTQAGVIGAALLVCGR